MRHVHSRECCPGVARTYCPDPARSVERLIGYGAPLTRFGGPTEADPEPPVEGLIDYAWLKTSLS